MAIESVVDSSAVLAALLDEPGADVAERWLRRSSISAVNVSEVVGKLVDLGRSEDEAIETALAALKTVQPFDVDLALAAGALRRATRSRGLSLGDRACLALARRERLPAVTADRAWEGLDLGVEVVLIR